MAYLPEDYNKGATNGQGAGPSTGGGSQAGASGQPAQGQAEPIQLSSSTASSSNQQAAPSQLNQNEQATQTQTQTQGPKGSGMGDTTTNLRQYTQQNQNVQLAQKIGQNLQGQATQVSQGIQQSGQKFQQQVAPEQQRLAAAPGVVNTALNPAKSQYFAGTQTLNPEKITLSNAQNLAGAEAAYQPQVAKLDQDKQTAYNNQYNSYFAQPTSSTDQTQNVGLDTTQGMTGQQSLPTGTDQTSTGTTQTSAPAVNQQLQTDYQNWKLSQLQTSNPDQYNQYQQAITPEGLQSGEQQYYQTAFAKFGALNPQSQWDQIQSQYSPEGIQASAMAAANSPDNPAHLQSLTQAYQKQYPENDFAGMAKRALNDPNFAKEFPVQDTFDKNAYAQQLVATQSTTADADKKAAEDSLLQNFGINRFDSNTFQSALLNHLGINPLTTDNAQLEAQNMLAAQNGLTAYDPAAYEKQLEDQQLASKMADVGQVQATPAEIAAGGGSTPAERLAYFQKLREGAVQQFNVQDAGDLQAKVQNLQTQADLGKTEAGRYQLLQNTFNNPDYTTGQQRLDQLLLQQQGGQQAQLKNLQQTLAKPATKQYNDLMATAGQTNTNLAQSAKGIQSNIWNQLIGTENPTVDASGQMITSPGGLIPNLEAQINSEVTAAGTKATADAQALKDKISAGADITAADLKNFLPAGTADEDVTKVLDYYNQSRPETLQNKLINKEPLNDADFKALMPMFSGQTFTQDQLERAYNKNAGGFADNLAKQFAENNMANSQLRTGDWKMDFSKYLTNPDTTQYTAANVANPEEYARYSALEALAGQNPNFLNPNNIAQAGTGLNNEGNFNISQAEMDANAIFHPPTTGNMGPISAPQQHQDEGSNIVSDLVATTAMNMILPGSGFVLLGTQFAEKTLGIDIPVVSDIAESISGSIADLGREIIAPFTGGGGSVICTECYRQGYISKEIWEKDRDYGANIEAKYPEVISGYHFWGIPAARLMKKSKLATWIFSKLAIPWANHVSGNKNFMGYILMLVGVPMCYIIGKILKGIR